MTGEHLHHCGRMGDHTAHWWTVRKTVSDGWWYDWTTRTQRRSYWCSGKVVREGGAWR